MAKVRQLRLTKERLLPKKDLDVNNVVIIAHFRTATKEDGSTFLEPFVNEHGYPFDVARITGIPSDSILRAKTRKAHDSADSYKNKNIEVCLLEPTFAKQCKIDTPLARIRNYGHNCCAFQTISCTPTKTSNKKQPYRNDLTSITISIDSITLGFSCLARQYKLPEVVKEYLDGNDHVLYSTESKKRVQHAKQCGQFLAERLSHAEQALRDDVNGTPTTTPGKDEQVFNVWTPLASGSIPSAEPVAVDYVGLFRDVAAGAGNNTDTESEDEEDDDMNGPLFTTNERFRAIKERLDIRLGQTQVQEQLNNNVSRINGDGLIVLLCCSISTY